VVGHQNIFGGIFRTLFGGANAFGGTLLADAFLPLEGIQHICIVYIIHWKVIKGLYFDGETLKYAV
jgi:hypothetical protein